MPALIQPDSLRFAGLVRSGDLVACGQGTAEPLTLSRRLVAQKDEIGPFSVFVGVTFSETFAPAQTDGISFTSFGAMGKCAALAKAGRLDILPLRYSRLYEAFASGALRADVVLLQLAVDDRLGYSLSLANDYVALAARHARVVIAEVNPHAPWTHGAELPPDIRLDVLVAADTPPQEVALPSFGEAEQKIAAYIAELIPDGACLQFGIGVIPAAALSCLRGHRDLGIHSGAITDGIIELIENGVITNARKSADQGIIVTNTVLGSRRLFDYVHRNPKVQVRPTSYTHSYDVVRSMGNFRAINSAIEVDLTGQINAEVAGNAYVGGIGGQVDFVTGALAAEGGRSIIALPATARGGTSSRIVSRLHTVTTPRSDADLVVTEYGIADLRNATLEERATRLIAIAAPQVRDDLTREWRIGGGRKA